MLKSQTTAHEPTKKNESDFGAHSNSPQSRQFESFAQNPPFPDFPEIHKVSWDKLSILGNLDPNRAQSLITAFCNEPNVLFRPDRSSRAFHATIMESVDCRFNMDGPSKNARNFKLEFNPNDVAPEFMAYLHSVIYPCLTDTGVSRIDLAIDTTEDLGTYYIDTVNPTSSVIYRGRGKQLETLYLGSRKRWNYIRIYDKKKQLGAKKREEIIEPTLWRIEFEMKGPRVAESWRTCTDNLLINKIEFPESVTLSQEMNCVALMDHPEYYNRMEKRQATRYRKMIKEAVGKDLMPILRGGLELSLDRLQSELDAWMKPIMNQPELSPDELQTEIEAWEEWEEANDDYIQSHAKGN